MASSYVDRSARHDASEGSGRDPQGFVGNDELGEPPPTRLTAAPGDADALDCSEDGTVCFACNFVKVKSNEHFNLAEASYAFTDLEKMITEQYTKISNPALVELISQFYIHEIQPLGDYPAWTKNSISHHDEDVMLNEAVSMLYAQIQSLRSRCCILNIHDNTQEIHHKHVTTLNLLLKSLKDTHGKRKQLRS